MACTQAQLDANRKNASLAKGPTSESGKRASRQNGLKHGLTGEGIVVPGEDAEEIARRFEALEAEMKPRTELARQLLNRIALMFVRLDRSAAQEAKAIAFRVRNAEHEFDEAQKASVDHLISWIASEPVTNNRRLKQTLVGTNRLIAQIEGLRSDLMRQPTYRWEYSHCDQLHHYLGMRREEMPITRIRALTEAIQGKFENIDPSEIPESEIMAKRRWAIGQMVDLLNDEIAKLKTVLETFDPAAIELDRAEAPARAMFDGSKEGILSRKYEAATERALFRTLREFHEAQAESAEPDIETEVTPEPAEELGSSFPAAPESEELQADLDPTPEIDDGLAARKRPDLEKLARKGRKRPKSA